MSVVYRKVWRDLMRNKGRTILVVLSIAVGVTAVGLIFSINNLLTTQMTLSQIASDPSHAKLYLDGYIDDETVRSLGNMQEIGEIEGAIETSIRWKRNLDDDWEQKQALLIARESYRDMPFDLYTLKSGDWPEVNAVDVEFNHQGPFNVPEVGQTLYLEVNEREEPLYLNGTLRDPSQFPPPNAQNPTFYVTREMMNKLTGIYNFNVLRFTIPQYSQEKAEIAVEAVKQRLKSQNVSITYYEIQDPQRHPMQDIANGIGLVLGLMAVMSLFLSVLLVINTINAIITQQIPQIGVMKTYGGMRNDVAKIYLAGVGIYGILSLVIALPLAAFGGYFIANWMLYLFNVPPARFSFPLSALLTMLIAGLLSPLLAGFVPILKGASITVKDAISSYGMGAADFGSGVVSRLLGRIRGLPRLVAMPLRNTFRRMGRLLLTELTLIAAGALFLTVLSTGSSVRTTIANAFKSFGYDILLVFKSPQRINEIVSLLGTQSNVARVEMWVWQDAKAHLPGVTGPGTEKDVALRGFPEDSEFYKPVIISGEGLDSQDTSVRQLLLNDQLAKDLGIEAGDSIVIDLGRKHVAVWEVAGLIQDLTPSGNTIYMYRDVLNQELNQVNQASVAEVKLNLPEETLDNHLAAIKNLEDFLKTQGIEPASTSSSIQEQEQFSAQLGILITVLLIMTVLVAIVGSVGLSGTLSINVIERIREIGVMRAVGASSSDLALIFIGEGLLIGLISWAIAIPISLVTAGLFVTILGGVIGVSVHYFYSVGGIFLWLFIVALLSLLASWLPAMNATRISIANSLAYE
jgi:putative ABC transport system permease protein